MTYVVDLDLGLAEMEGEMVEKGKVRVEMVKVERGMGLVDWALETLHISGKKSQVNSLRIFLTGHAEGWQETRPQLITLLMILNNYFWAKQNMLTYIIDLFAWLIHSKIKTEVRGCLSLLATRIKK